MNLPTAPHIPQANINLGLSTFNPAINKDIAASESPSTRNLFGVGWKYPFSLIFLILYSNIVLQIYHLQLQSNQQVP